MKKIIGSCILSIIGWKIKVSHDFANIDKCILVSAPHTSNWDFILGILTFWKLERPLKVIIKDSHTKAFYGGIIRWLGGIGVDRSQRNNLVDFIKQEFEHSDFSLVITPESSRSFSKKWKLGFYHIAIGANVPICLAYADYKHKELGLGKEIKDIKNRSLEDILKEIEGYYLDKNARFPEQYNPKIF